MKLSQLLEEIRRPYLVQLSKAAAAGNYHIEPAARCASGAVALDGEPQTPIRYDFLDKDSGAVHAVDATEVIDFEPLQMDWDGQLLQISPFTWDALTLEIIGLAPDTASEQVRDWFMHWFDEDDTNVPDANRLYGVPHFMSDAMAREDGSMFQLDLGSVSPNAVLELIERLLDVKAKVVKLGGTAAVVAPN